MNCVAIYDNSLKECDDVLFIMSDFWSTLAISCCTRRLLIWPYFSVQMTWCHYT